MERNASLASSSPTYTPENHIGRTRPFRRRNSDSPGTQQIVE